MNLIISLLGQNHGDLFSEKFIINHKSRKNNFLLDEILNNFRFCNKIYIIVEKNNIITKNILFSKKKNSKKINIIFSKSTRNQIQSILKLKKFISENESVIILNPDSYFKINYKDFNYKNDGLIFYIDSQDLGRNLGKKDLLFTNFKDQIVKIKKREEINF